MTLKSLMERETEESHVIILNQQNDSINILNDLTERLLKYPPHFVGTVARGSSDHAAYFAKYAIETQIQIVTASISPSIHSIYKSNLNYKNSLILGISQSGKSTDLIESIKYARKNGAITLSFINEPSSPLAEVSEYCIPLLAEKEHSIAATKSFIASLARIIQLVAHWSKNKNLTIQLNELPSLLLNKNHHSQKIIKLLKNESNIFVIGRGFGFPIALETALKLKETCGIHAEAFSGAEVFHGPVELLYKNYPVIVFLQNDETLPSMIQLINKLNKLKTKVILITSQIILDKYSFSNKILIITTNYSASPLCNSILSLHCLYPIIAELAKAKKRNPDVPNNLNKVTNTI